MVDTLTNEIGYAKFYPEYLGSTSGDGDDDGGAGGGGVVNTVNLAPANGYTLVDSSQTFTWDTVPGYLYGVRVGGEIEGKNYLASGALAAIASITATGLPTDGSPIYLRLTINDGTGTNKFVYRTYTAQTVVVVDPDPDPPPVGGTYDRYQSILNSPYRIGFGRNATGAPLSEGVPVNEMIVTNTNDSGAGSLRAAWETDGAFVRMDPALGSAVVITIDSSINPGENTTFDGRDVAVTLRPGSYSSKSIIVEVRKSNTVTIRLKIDGENDANGANGFRILNGDDHLVLGLEVTRLTDDAFGCSDGNNPTISATNTTLGFYKVYNTPKGYITNQDKQAMHTAGRVTGATLLFSDLAANDRNPRNSGGYMHVICSYIHGWTFSANLVTVADDSSVAAETLSENCVYEDPPGDGTKKDYGQRAEDSDLATNPASPSQRHYHKGCVFGPLIRRNQNSEVIDISDGSDAPQILDTSYDYSLMPANQVKAFVTANAGLAFTIPFQED